VKTLMDLGLTLVQAKTYLALCRLDNATIKAISEASNLARQDTYRIMPALQNMGLAEKIVANPTKYRAIHIKDGVSRLLFNKSQEQAKLQKKTRELLRNIEEDAFQRETPEDKDEFQLLIISEISLLLKKLMEGTRLSQVSIDSVGTWESFEGIVSIGYSDFKKALQRGVKIRSITERPPKDKKLPNYIKTLQKHPLYELRFISSPSPVTMAILDKKKLSICISIPDGKAVSTLWSNNLIISGLALNYFHELWDKATLSKQEKKRKN
jgi:sugar-specific transcriptional regulator TrmB